MIIRTEDKNILGELIYYTKVVYQETKNKIMLNLLKGKLTFTLAGLSVLYAIVGLLFGWISNETALQIAWAGLAVFGLRRAINE